MRLSDLYRAVKTGYSNDLRTMGYARVLRNAAASVIKTLSGTLPLSFTAKGMPLLDYALHGNTIQDGAPTPSAPVAVVGCGDYDADTGLYKIPISVQSKDGSESVTAVYLDKPIYKITDYADFVNYSEGIVKRYVKELVLTGDERWQYIDNCFRLLYSAIHDGAVPVTCTHFGQTTMYLLVNGGSGIAPCGGYYGSKYKGFAIRYDDLFTAVTDFKTYLAEQYNNGTPVKIYYVLATPETESVNLPQIHTFDGMTTLDASTTVKPSSVEIEYR